MPQMRSGVLRAPQIRPSEKGHSLGEARDWDSSPTCPDDQLPSADALAHSRPSVGAAADLPVCSACGGDLGESGKEEALRETADSRVVHLNEVCPRGEHYYERPRAQSRPGLEEIVCHSECFRKTLEKMEKVAGTDATVLLLGESGTGKGLLAGTLHSLSPRGERAFIQVNCAALHSNLIESEFFGHERGAFTGAVNRKIGRFQLADGGTIFLDEIGELPIELQGKLLRVLQDGEFEPIGCPVTKHVDVRVIAATNRNLEEAMESGKFREDLYYRLNVFPIKVPPLRARREAIVTLASHFVAKYGPALGKAVRSISEQTMDAFLAYSWPGNVRELENVVQRGLILSDGPMLELDEPLGGSSCRESPRGGLEAVESLERATIVDALDRCNWIVAGKRGAAAVLNLPPSTLRDRMKRLGLKA